MPPQARAHGGMAWEHNGANRGGIANVRGIATEKSEKQGAGQEKGEVKREERVRPEGFEPPTF